MFAIGIKKLIFLTVIRHWFVSIKHLPQMQGCIFYET